MGNNLSKLKKVQDETVIHLKENEQSNVAPPIPTEVQNETLSEYFEYLYTETLCFKRPHEEVCDITEAVSELVNKILDEVGVVDERFEKLRVLFVGSMSEGTRNGEPDEFDFLVIIKSLSTSDDLRFMCGCKKFFKQTIDGKGYAHIEIKENASTRFQTEREYKAYDKNLIRTKVVGRFWSSFRLVLTAAVIRVRIDTMIKKPTGSLFIADWFVHGHGPACLCRFLWIGYKTGNCPKYLVISVDITPAIQVVDVESVADRNDFDSEMYQLLTDTGGCLLVAPCYTELQYRNTLFKESTIPCCFKLAFTNAEIVLMKALPQNHRKCYRILKYLFHVLDPMTPEMKSVFHSYALKTVVINHARANLCNESETGCLAKCILSILEQIEKCIASGSPGLIFGGTFQISLGSVFMPSLNIFEKPLDSFAYKRVLERIKEMCLSLVEIANADLSSDLSDRHDDFKRFEI